VFNGLTVKQASKSHRTGILYVLVPADGSNPGGLPSGNLNLLDALDGDADLTGGDVGETSGDLEQSASPQIGPIESIGSPAWGDVGDVGDLSKEACARKTQQDVPDIDEEWSERENFTERSAGNSENVSPSLPSRVTDTKHVRLGGETFGANVSPTSTKRPHAESGGVIDLAKLPAARGKDPP
jgi:hypothetical protein